MKYSIGSVFLAVFTKFSMFGAGFFIPVEGRALLSEGGSGLGCFAIEVSVHR